MNITITISEADAARIAYRASSVQGWVEGAVDGCAQLSQMEIEQTPEWGLAMVEHVRRGGDPGDKDAVLLTGVAAGIIKSAAERAAAAGDGVA